MKGILGKKVGMTQVFDEETGNVEAVTVIEAGPCPVVTLRTEAADGYDAVQLAFADPRPRSTTKPMEGHFDAHGGKPGRYVVELRTDDASSYEPGQEIKADVFSPGDRTDVVGVSRGKGFAGPMKRHGFSGLGAGHGTQRKHRAPGSIGACATPSRVFKGMRMAGQMGNERVTVLNLEVFQADPERNLLLLKGAVPGPTGGLLMVRSAVKAPAGAEA
jgi:large subunit ribosomal protein L3